MFFISSAETQRSRVSRILLDQLREAIRFSSTQAGLPFPAPGKLPKPLVSHASDI
jgi:hypothetical protein